MTLSPALVRLERTLSRSPTTILSTDDVQLLDREVRRALADSFQNLPEEALDRSEDLIRWRALGACCEGARRARGIRDVAVATARWCRANRELATRTRKLNQPADRRNKR